MEPYYMLSRKEQERAQRANDVVAVILCVVMFLLVAATMGCKSGSDKEGGSSTTCASARSGIFICGNSDTTVTVVQDNSRDDALDASVVTSFLWKPESESDGKLAVLANVPGASVSVYGDIAEDLRNTGPSNGFALTARGTYAGCAYGDGVRVEFRDASGALVPVLFDGIEGDFISIEKGCDRVSF